MVTFLSCLTAMRSTRSIPQGRPIHNPGRDGTATTRPKRLTTARSPGRISLTPVSNQATRSRAGTRRSSQRFTSIASHLRRRFAPFQRRQGGEEQAEELRGPDFHLRLVHGEVSQLSSLQLGVIVSIPADGLVEDQVGFAIGRGA